MTLIYLLKSGACLLLFMAFYKLLLEKEPMHQVKRWYLLLAPLLALAIPLISFTTYVDPVESPLLVLEGKPVEEVFTFVPEETRSRDYTREALWAVYGLGLLLFGLRFIGNLVKLLLKARAAEKVRKDGFVYVLLEGETAPHTFLGYIFLNRQAFELGRYPSEVLWHEQVHARQRHSIDLLLMSVLEVLFWFNPLVYGLKSFARLNHEFLADEGVLRKGTDARTYQKLILAYSTHNSALALASAFQFSFIKNRIMLMKKKPSKQSIWLRNLMVLPLITLSLYGFSNKVTAIRPVPEEAILQEAKTPKPVPVDNLEEYNKLARHYGEYPAYDFVTKVKDMRRMRHYYEALSEEEKAQAVQYPKSTTGMTINITDDGKYLLGYDQKSVTLAEIEAIFIQLNEEEKSNAFVFASMGDVGRYVEMRGSMNKYDIPAPNDTYVHIHAKALENKAHEKWPKAFSDKGMRSVEPAGEHPPIKPYLDDILNMFRKVGIQVDY